MAHRSHVLLLFLILRCEAYANEWDSVSRFVDTSNYDDTIESELNGTPVPTDLQVSDKQSVESLQSQYTFHPETGSWIEALVTCWKNGKELAIPRSPQEAGVLSELLFQNTGSIDPLAEMKDAVHIGVLDINNPNEWVTIEGQKLSQAGYNQWLDGGEGRCGALYSDGRFFKQSCKTQLAFICQTVQKNSIIDQNYTRIPGVGRFRLHTSPLPWIKAQKQCEAEGGALAVPSSARVAGLVAGALLVRASSSERSAGCFIGANDVAKEGRWVVISGLTLQQSGYESWRPNQPSGNRSENCAVLMEDGLYEDISCLSPLPFCCEIPEYPTGTSETVFESGGYRLHVESLSWWEAVMSCHKQNMTLASPRTWLDGDQMKSLIHNGNSKVKNNLQQVHIGIHNMNKMNIWESLEGNFIRYEDSSYENVSFDLNMFYKHRVYSRTPETGASCGSMDLTRTYFSYCFVKRPYVCASSN